MDRTFEDTEKLKQLLTKFKDGECTVDELKLIKTWWLHYRESKESDENALDARIISKDLATVWQLLDANQSHQIRRRRIYRITARAAAAVLLVAVCGLVVWQQRTHTESPLTSGSKKNTETVYAFDVPPGGNKATLLTPEGTLIELEEDGDGIVIEEAISYRDGRSIVHKAGATNNTADHWYGIATPRGGTYRIQLADGSQVRLNADTRLEYPLQFGEKTRTVRLEGEAFFDIVPNPDRPFIVETANESIRVLGTKFNVSAYPDDEISATTLAEGRVEVTIDGTDGEVSHVLNPNQQSRVSGKTMTIQQVDAARTLAWKDNVFRFQEDAIGDIMKVLSRWYAIDVIYEGEPTAEKFSGKISRNRNISQVLNLLERTKAVRFRIDTVETTNERRVIVMN